MVHDVTRQPFVFSLQMCVAVPVCSREPTGSVAVELRHGAAVFGHPGAQPLKHQQRGEHNCKSTRGEHIDLRLSVHRILTADLREDEQPLFFRFLLTNWSDLQKTYNTECIDVCLCSSCSACTCPTPPPSPPNGNILLIHLNNMKGPYITLPELIPEDLISWAGVVAAGSLCVRVHMWGVKRRCSELCPVMSWCRWKAPYQSSVCKMVPVDSSGVTACAVLILCHRGRRLSPIQK